MGNSPQRSAQLASMRAAREAGNTPPPGGTDEPMDSPLYHGTSRANMDSIARYGLDSNDRVRNDWGEKRGEDPDNPREQHLLYFTHEPDRGYGQVQLRFSEDDLPRGVGTDEDQLLRGEFYATGRDAFTIEPEAIQFRNSQGHWRPVSEWPS